MLENSYLTRLFTEYTISGIGNAYAARTYLTRLFTEYTITFYTYEFCLHFVYSNWLADI